MGRTPYFWPNIPTTGPEIKEFIKANFIIKLIIRQNGCSRKYLRIRKKRTALFQYDVICIKIRIKDEMFFAIIII